jgi:Fic family protein
MHYFYEHLDSDIKALLLAQIRSLWTHYSTALEGNSLTLGETDFILSEGLTIQGKPLKDHNEIYGHAKAIELIYTLLSTEAISPHDLFRLHETVLTEHITDIDQPVGKWKTQSNFTTYIDANHKQAWREYPVPKNIERLMTQWLVRLNQSLGNANSQEQAAVYYAELQLSFVTIHPFFDGNGRLARLLANLPVLKSGYPPIVVPQQDRYHYKLSLSAYQNTIADLPALHDLAQLPENAEKRAFIELCKGYWTETLELLNKANEIQGKRSHE